MQCNGLCLWEGNLEQLTRSPKDRIIIRENAFFQNFAFIAGIAEKESHLKVVFVMISYVTTRSTMTKMERKINLLMKL